MTPLQESQWNESEKEVLALIDIKKETPGTCLMVLAAAPIM